MTQSQSRAMKLSMDSAVDALDTFCIDLLQELVRTPSITGNEKPAQERIAARLAEMGLAVDVWSPTLSDLADHPAFSDDGFPLGDRPVVVAKWAGTDPGAPSLILNGHMDVVPTGDDRAWTGGPWSGEVRDGKLWGRGSCDMKGGLAAGVTAVAALQKLGIKPRGDVLIESVIGEETGGAGTLASILRGYRADAAIILEPTRMALCPVGAGALSFRIRVHGRAAHAATRQEGISAIAKFYHLMQALEELERERHREFHHVLFQPGELVAPISIGKIEAGDWPSTVPETLVAEGRYGVLPGENIQTARTQFAEALNRAIARDEWLSAHPPDMEWFEGQFESGETPLDAPVIHKILQAHHDVNGHEPRLHGVPYGSDLRLFTNNGGMNALLYGPGDVRIAHSLNEFVPLDEVRRVTKVLVRAIIDWSGWT